MNTKDTIHIYCTQKLRVKLQILAGAHHRTMSAEVQDLIDKAYKLYLSEQTKDQMKG